MLLDSTVKLGLVFEEVKIGRVRKPRPYCTYVLYSWTRSVRRNRRARDINIIIDLILFYIYISASFNHTMHLLREALIYTECIPSMNMRFKARMVQFSRQAERVVNDQINAHALH